MKTWLIRAGDNHKERDSISRLEGKESLKLSLMIEWSDAGEKTSESTSSNGRDYQKRRIHGS